MKFTSKVSSSHITANPYVCVKISVCLLRSFSLPAPLPSPFYLFSARQTLNTLDYHTVMSLSSTAPTKFRITQQGYTYPINGVWQHDRKLYNQLTFRYCFHFLYQLIGLPFAVARAFLQGVKRSLLAPFL